MAVVTTKSAAITNRDASPKVKNSSFVEYGRVRSAVGVVAAVSGDSIASKYIMCQIPSNSRVVDVLLDTVTITVGAGDIGLYQTTDNGGAVLTAAFFAAATTLVGPIARKTLKGGSYSVANLAKRVWEAAALASDSAVMYDVTVTLTTAITTTGTVAVEVLYVVD